VFIKLGIAIAIAIAVEIELEIAAIGEDLNNDPDCWDSRRVQPRHDVVSRSML